MATALRQAPCDILGIFPPLAVPEHLLFSENRGAISAPRWGVGRTLAREHGKVITAGLAAWSVVHPVLFDARHTVAPATNWRRATTELVVDSARVSRRS